MVDSEFGTARRAGPRIAGRVGECVGESEFVWGTRNAASGRSVAGRSRSRESPTQPAARWSLPLTLPHTLAALRRFGIPR